MTTQPQEQQTDAVKPAHIYPPDAYDANGVSVLVLMPAGEPYTPAVDGIYVPYWYFEKLFDYIVDTQEMQNARDAE